MKFFSLVHLLLLTTICICSAANISAQSADFPPNPLEKPGWTLVCHDEFDGASLNDSLWIPEYFPGRFETPWTAKYEVKDGLLLLSGGPGIQTYNCHNLHKEYLNPPEKVPTVYKFTQLYGYYEIRARNSMTAHHIAFWVLEAKPNGGEVDITEDEGYGGPNWHIHVYNEDRRIYKHYDDITTHKQRCEGFHLYAIEIHEKGIRIYHDNQLLEEANVDWKARGEVPLAFLLGIYDNPEGGQAYAVDYFRAYRR